MIFLYFIIFTLIFIIYSELSVKNILIRYDSQNNQSINLASLFHFLSHSFIYKTLWNINTLDINYFFCLSLFFIFYFIAFYLRKNIYYLQI